MSDIFLKNNNIELSINDIINNWNLLYKYYVSSNEDVKLLGYTDYCNSLRHYIKIGYKEKRSFGFILNYKKLDELKGLKLYNNCILSNNKMDSIHDSTNKYEFKMIDINLENSSCVMNNSQNNLSDEDTIKKNDTNNYLYSEKDIKKQINSPCFIDLQESDKKLNIIDEFIQN